jgi:hypothetical protein
MSTGDFWVFALTILATVTAPAVFVLAARGGFQRSLNALIVVLTAGILIFQLLPESLRILGVWSLALAAVGAGLPGLIEHLFHRAAAATHALTLGLGILGLMLHATMDGSVMTSGQVDRAGLWLPLAVAIHRVPVAMSLWWLAKRHFGYTTAIAVNASLVVGTILGYVYAGQLVDSLSGTAFHVFQSLMAGSVLHVLFHRPHGPDHKGHDHERHAELRFARHEWMGGILGAIVLALLLLAMR